MTIAEFYERHARDGRAILRGTRRHPVAWLTKPRVRNVKMELSVTDEQRFRLDEELRAQHTKATADLSRFKQQALDYAEWLGRLSHNLKHTPQTTQLRQAAGSSAWIWTYSPQGQGLEERQLPNWSEVDDATKEIRRLGIDVVRLEQELRARQLL